MATLYAIFEESPARRAAARAGSRVRWFPVSLGLGPAIRVQRLAELKHELQLSGLLVPSDSELELEPESHGCQ